MINSIEHKEKSTVAIGSVVAAVFLTGMKLVIGLLTGSLGIISEALHSGLDMIAAIMTLFAVKIADKPADYDHNFGHGKVENFSALIETMLLLLTCGWIVYEAANRLATGHTSIEINVWSFTVIIVSIIIDITRSIRLRKVAKKYNSQALAADALHFSTDIYSSGVVIIGLIGVMLGYHIADSIAALFVAVIVIFISFRLGKKSIDDLLDRSPVEMTDEIAGIISQIPDVKKFHDIKLRNSGSLTFVELNIHVDPQNTIEKAHDISHLVELKIKEKFNRCEVHIHAEPEHFY